MHVWKPIVRRIRISDTFFSSHEIQAESIHNEKEDFLRGRVFYVRASAASFKNFSQGKYYIFVKGKIIYTGNCGLEFKRICV